MPLSLTRRTLLASAALPLLRSEDKWINLFDGQSLTGWTPSENKSSWKVTGGCLSADGPRSHLFYSGPVSQHRFKNFELEVEALAKARANSGVYFHTEFQDSGWPAKGFEIQVNGSALGERGYLERKKTGSLYGVRNVYKQLIADDTWFRLNLSVRGKNIQVRINGTLVTEYTEPATPLLADNTAERGRLLSSGTIALQCHDEGSKALYRAVRIRPLPDDATPPADAAPPAPTDDVARAILRLSAANIPMVDYHGHLKSGFTLPQLLAHGRHQGIFYGVAINCGKGFTVQDNAGARRFHDEMQGQPCFAAMQAEGREWTQMFSPQAAGLFDYIFTDSMTWTDNHGRRMRTWIPAEVGQIPDAQEFMETLVARATGILNSEPVDIYVNPTFIPEQLAPRYDELWTDERILKVVRAAKANQIAIEINNRYKLPGRRVLEAAKAEGCQFAFGTNNSSAADIGRCEYGLEMAAALKLRWQDFFVPAAKGNRAIDRKPEALKG
ncbi:MAG: DUF1080 domain-containing protein [Acidobacteria bacterium]|nr:DUF1080 domain-containing protein [Acidobacteriota bacterium]